MQARDLITDEIPPLKVTDTGIKVLKWMDEFKVTHLPVVEGVEYMGMVSDHEILDLNQPENALNAQQVPLHKVYVSEEQHFFEVVKLIAVHNLTVVPVLDALQQYMGAITLGHLMKQMAGMASIHDAGGIIILEMNQNDYSLQEIARIVEGNDARVLSVYMTSDPDSTKMEVTLKINRLDLGGILQTFSRYNYTVKASFQESRYGDDLKDRYDSLMNYLNM